MSKVLYKLRRGIIVKTVIVIVSAVMIIVSYKYSTTANVGIWAVSFLLHGSYLVGKYPRYKKLRDYIQLHDFLNPTNI